MYGDIRTQAPHRKNPYMTDHTRPPTAREVKELRQRARLTQGELATLLGLARYSTVSDWERGEAVPTITLGYLQEVIATRTAPASVFEAQRRDRDFTATLLAMIRSDAEDIQASARRQLEKLDAAQKFLGGATPTVSAAVEREESQALPPEPPARPTRSRRRQGHR